MLDLVTRLALFDPPSAVGVVKGVKANQSRLWLWLLALAQAN